MARLRLLLLGLASGSAFYSGITPALGLGEINLHSALNQPLDAEIELFQVGDLGEQEIKVRLASAEEFSRIGVERFYFLNDLRFTPVLSGGRGLIRVQSNKPVREPYLNFIVEVARPGGNLLREYTLLIDPPGSSAYTPQAAPAPQPAVNAWRSDPARPLPQASRGERYRVQRGDSLWSIAGRLQAAGATLGREALMSDIHALNPQAFSNGDPGRLRADVELLLPDAAQATPAVEPAPLAAQAAVAQPEVDTAQSEVAEQQRLQAEQARVDAELAEVNTQNLQLQNSLSELQVQLQQLQAQMAEKDLQMQQLREQLEQQARPAAPVAPQPASPVIESRGAGWSFWLAGVVLLALLVGMTLWLVRRQRPQPEPEPLRRPLEEPRMVSRPVQEKVVESVARPVVPAAQPLEQRVPPVATDPLEGANIYIAYGRFADAANSLRKAIEQQPERLDLRLRMLEVCGELGDAAAFFEQERQLHEMGASHVQVDQIRARFGHLQQDQDQAAPQLAAMVEEPEQAAVLQDDFQLNLDDLSLDADWGLASPFQPEQSARAKAEKAQQEVFDPDFSSNLQELPEVAEMNADDGLLASFAELPQEQVLDEDIVEAFSHEQVGRQASASVHPFEPLADNFEHLASNRDHLVRLNTALAYIEQGDIGSACDILNELISEGDEQQRERARELLAKIA
ncbi:FimV/HubP family polar landmark protein [Pseudomonas sp. BMS12]|uniref:FimV/HubP family polar landmark protein n=1 Tax=Pseudomonas sp. BMS12 TaxID=1796033 RepID=UPI000A8A54A1|nr:FimV/HubP family polar landmark protein [Pseudomonas sp. BMS12]